MRIAVLTSLYPSRVRPHEGLFAERRWTGMRGRGHEVRVVHPLPWAPPLASLRPAWAEIARMSARETRSGIEIERPRYVHLPGRALGNARRFARRGIAALLARGAPEVVVADYAWPSAAAAPELAARGVACVVSGRGSDVIAVAERAPLKAALARGLRAAGHWCAVSQDLVRRMDELGGAPGRGVLVPNGVDLELFRPRERAAARAELGLPAAGRVVLVVGHLIERKDPLLALRSFAAALGRDPAAQIVFVGRGPLGPALEREAASLGLAQRARLLGELEPARLASAYAAADALVLTSRREGRPNVVLEALASGLPVVATPAGGTAELLAGLEGALVESREPERIGAALASALARAPAPEVLRARVAPLSWDASLAALEGCLAAAVRARPGGAA